MASWVAFLKSLGLAACDDPEAWMDDMAEVGRAGVGWGIAACLIAELCSCDVVRWKAESNEVIVSSLRACAWMGVLSRCHLSRELELPQCGEISSLLLLCDDTSTAIFQAQSAYPST